MQQKFRNTYRIPSARRVGWDYAENGAYFITICTAGKEHCFGDAVGRDAINRVCTCTGENRMCTEEKIKRGGVTGNKNPMFHDSVSRIIRWYKGRVTFESRKIHADFAWQSRFHDHIIRNQKSFERIQTYIQENPMKWTDDTYYLQ
ncbi:MAG: transposase [bacterium]